MLMSVPSPPLACSCSRSCCTHLSIPSPLSRRNMGCLGSYYNIPKAILDLPKGEHIPSSYTECLERTRILMHSGMAVGNMGSGDMPFTGIWTSQRRGELFNKAAVQHHFCHNICAKTCKIPNDLDCYYYC